MTTRTRLLVILGLIALSIFYLVPRDVTLRERDPDTGVMRNRVVKRIPLKRGLDLQGGMHLALELDESQRAVTDKADAINRALTVVRTRIDEFGVSEPVVQKAGDERIIVELPGIDD